MHGMTNPWGFDYDEFGEIFVTNTVIGHLWHVVPGARTERMFGQDFNPHAYQLISQVADHVHWNTEEVWDNVRKGVTESTSAAGGGHAHTGLLIYQGGNWPKKYRGRLFTLNIHGRRVNSDLLEREAVDYVAHHSADMCFIGDPWFRGMDLISGADGGAFIADWSDTGECHEWGGVHRTSGRIYKLAHGDPGLTKPFDLAKSSDAELVQLQESSNDWYSRRARLILQERAATKKLDMNLSRKALLRMFAENKDPVVRMRAMWTLWLCNCVDDNWLLQQLRHPDEHVRVWAVRFLADERAVDDADKWQPIVNQFKQLASNEQSGLVLLYLTAALQEMPLEMRMPIAEQIALRTDLELNANRALSIMLWLAIEPAVAQNPGESLRLLTSSTFPLVRENIARRLTLNIDSDQTAVERLLEAAVTDQPLAADIIRGMAAALNGRNSAPVPTNWKSAFASLRIADSAEIRDGLDSIGVVFGDAAVMESLSQTLQDAGAKPEKKNRALQLLLASRSRDLSTTLIQLINDPDLAVEAIRGLARYEHPKVPAILLGRYDQLRSEEKTAAINTLTSRKGYALALVEAMEAKRVPPTDITAFQARQVMALGDAEMSNRLTAVWGDARQTPEDKQKLIHDLRVILTPRIASGDIKNGKALFGKTCASCHVLFGQGTTIGPDLTGSDRKNLEYLLENMIDPSAIVGAGFRVSVFILNDGRIVSGIVTEENDRTVTVNTPEGKQVIDRQNIEEVELSEKSLMPDGLLQTLGDAEVCDLLAYLMSN
jgi:putative heme-binding domain-containing protein